MDLLALLVPEDLEHQKLYHLEHPESLWDQDYQLHLEHLENLVIQYRLVDPVRQKHLSDLVGPVHQMDLDFLNYLESQLDQLVLVRLEDLEHLKSLSLAHLEILLVLLNLVCLVDLENQQRLEHLLHLMNQPNLVYLETPMDLCRQ
jgi:hypothetical protein